MTEDREWFNVGVVKLPEAERDVAASVFRDHPERFYDIVGADTAEDDERFGLGTHTTYSALLTEREAEAFSRASNVRWISPNVRETGILQDPHYIPSIRAQRYLRADYDWYPSLTGTGIPIAVLDEGTGATSRSAKNLQLLAKTYFTKTEPTGEIWASDRSHGTLSACNAVPYGGQLLDALVIDEDTGGTEAFIASAITWAVTKGARLINMSLGFQQFTPAIEDAIAATIDRDVAIFASAGNEGNRAVRAPAVYSQFYPHVHSIASINMIDNIRSKFSNYGPFITGIAPGEFVYSIYWDGREVEWFGTSAACPHVVQMAARIMSTGVSARQAQAALAASLVDMGLGEQQGGGLYSMQGALRWLGKEPPIMVSSSPARPAKPGLPF